MERKRTANQISLLYTAERGSQSWTGSLFILYLSTRWVLQNSHDATSVMLLVQKLQQESYDPILLYKPQGGAVVVGSSDINLLPNSDDLFMLGIQSREQKECLEAF